MKIQNKKTLQQKTPRQIKEMPNGILAQWFISTLPENVSKPKVFFIFLAGIKVEHWSKMD